MADEPTIRRRYRSQTRATNAMRRIIVEDEDFTSPQPPAQPEPFMPAVADRYEFEDVALPQGIAERIAFVARYDKAAAKELRIRYLRPLMIKGASAMEIAQLFKVSTVTANRWKREFWEENRDVLGLKVDPLQEYANAMQRLEAIQSMIFSDIMLLRGQQGQDGAPALNNPRRTLHANYRAYLAYEQMRTNVNAAYGVAHDTAVKTAQLNEGAAREEMPLAKAAKRFIEDIEALASLDDDVTDLEVISRAVGDA